MRRSKNYLLQEQAFLFHLIKYIQDLDFDDPDSNKVSKVYIERFKEKLTPEFKQKI